MIIKKHRLDKFVQARALALGYYRPNPAHKLLSDWLNRGGLSAKIAQASRGKTAYTKIEDPVLFILKREIDNSREEKIIENFNASNPILKQLK
jgi:hypothetical protein